MTRHIHADLMMQYAQDALETDKPWERWEFLGKLSRRWISFDESIPLAWWPDSQYRRKTTPYEPTLLDQALELEIEARLLRIKYYENSPQHVVSWAVVRLEQCKAQRSPAMIEYLKQQGKL